MNGHPFGELINQYLNRKRGLSQNKLAAGILQAPAVISRMCKGERLTGPQARERVVSIISWFCDQAVLTTVVEANALLEAAGMARLQANHAEEAQLLDRLADSQLGHPATAAKQVASWAVTRPVKLLDAPSGELEAPVRVGASLPYALPSPTGPAEAGIIMISYETRPPPLSPAEAKERRDLGILLRKVKQFWIEGVLEKSIHTALLLELGKEIDLEAVEHPWEQVLELPDQTRQSLPPDKAIGDLFEEMNRALLILGEPGSGKTVTLLELARTLITQAEKDATFSQPVPVVFNLSTWTKGQPFIDWLVAELTAKYQIPKQIGQPWLENNRLLPLLDGLNEVEPENRAACVEAINYFGERFGLAGLVVCSRLEAYTELPVRLKLNGAIRLQPLTLEQVDHYLAVAGPKLEVLRAALQDDIALQNLAQSPLMLDIMSLAYQDVEALAGRAADTIEARRKHLFDVYIGQMFRRRRTTAQPYNDRQAIAWLSWLAQQMIRHHQTIFLIEQLQPSWLSSRPWCQVYVLGSRLIGGLFVGLFVGLFAGLFVGLSEGLLVGLFVGLPVGLFDALRFKRSDQNIVIHDLPRWRSAINVFSVAWLSFGLLEGLFLGLLFGLKGRLNAGLFFELGVRQHGLSDGLIVGVLGGLIFGLFFGLFFGERNSRQSLTNDIQTVEALSWSWDRGLKGGILGLLVGLMIWVIVGLILGSMAGQIYGQSFGLFLGLLGGLIYGLSSQVVGVKTTPNHGIWLSIRNASFTGLLGGLLGGLIFGLHAGLSFGPSFGLSFGLLAALWYGGFDIIQHYTLRLILWYKGYTPRNYTHFLNYATERIFLQKVGGGFIFIHRLLLEHFAAMDKEGKGE